MIVLVRALTSRIRLGQLLFGYLADVYGRKKMYGIELMIIIVCESPSISLGILSQFSLCSRSFSNIDYISRSYYCSSCRRSRSCRLYPWSVDHVEDRNGFGYWRR